MLYMRRGQNRGQSVNAEGFAGLLNHFFEGISKVESFLLEGDASFLGQWRDI